jgi:Rrf2 family protein
VFSQTIEYALRAFLYIARRSPETVRLREVAEASNAPPRYLAKLLADLARAGLLDSTRGPNGGYRVAPRKKAASLADVASVFEPVQPRRCLLGHGICGESPQCAVHDRWSPIAHSLNAFLASTTVAEIVRGDAPIPPSTST